MNSVTKINAFEKGAVFLDLGQQYWFGDGKKQDYALAVFNFKLAAEKGNAQAAAFLGDAFLYGKGVEIDYEKAFQYYLKGANAGDPFAQTGLSVMYLEGYSIPRNLDKAVFWAKKAADQNVSQGWYSLAICYLAYHDAERDGEAFQIFKKNFGSKCRRGIYRTRRLLSRWNRRGPKCTRSRSLVSKSIAFRSLVEKNFNKMLYYLKKAAAAGEQSAIQELSKYKE